MGKTVIVQMEICRTEVGQAIFGQTVIGQVIIGQGGAVLGHLENEFFPINDLSTFGKAITSNCKQNASLIIYNIIITQLDQPVLILHMTEIWLSKTVFKGCRTL